MLETKNRTLNAGESPQRWRENLRQQNYGSTGGCCGYYNRACEKLRSFRANENKMETSAEHQESRVDICRAHNEERKRVREEHISQIG